MWLHHDEKGRYKSILLIFVGMSQNVVCKILRHRHAGHFRSWESPDLPPLTTKIVDHWQANVCRRIRKIWRCLLCGFWRIHYGIKSTFFAKLVVRVWFNVITELEEYLYPQALLFPIQVLDLAGLGGVNGCWSDTGFVLSSEQECAASLIVQMRDRLSQD